MENELIELWVQDHGNEDLKDASFFLKPFHIQKPGDCLPQNPKWKLYGYVTPEAADEIMETFMRDFIRRAKKLGVKEFFTF